MDKHQKNMIKMTEAPKWGVTFTEAIKKVVNKRTLDRELPEKFTETFRRNMFYKDATKAQITTQLRHQQMTPRNVCQETANT